MPVLKIRQERELRYPQALPDVHYEPYFRPPHACEAGAALEPEGNSADCDQSPDNNHTSSDLRAAAQTPPRRDRQVNRAPPQPLAGVSGSSERSGERPSGGHRTAGTYLQESYPSVHPVASSYHRYDLQRSSAVSPSLG